MVGALLKERSRRYTVTAVLDRLVDSGKFVEYRTDGSCWFARLPVLEPAEGEATEFSVFHTEMFPKLRETPAERAGRELRERTPRSAHAEFAPAADRPSVMDSVESANEGRIASLIPLRVGRMADSPFSFLRGSAGLMATDLAATPNTGLAAQLCGDAQAANVGVYGGSDGQIVIDINDFDETVSGPWEWDLKRLATSLVVAGREVAGPAGEPSVTS